MNGDRDRRSREVKRETILEAALECFAAFGFRGTTVDMIAGRAGMSKPNLLYYFGTKQKLHAAVLERTLAQWLEPLSGMRADGEPLAEIEAYLERKIELSRTRPEASRLFATEIIQGAPHIRGVLQGHLRELVEEKCAVIQSWIDAGKLAPVEPLHLIFAIWAMTQHYADYEAQVEALAGRNLNDVAFAQAARQTMRILLIKGLEPRDRASSD
ncbi:MAG: TetR family transcriptional regulator C-terminal domain-containing protein [Geminicoccaceae bacterium]|nr:TetR family transcriptional regulator C-terminal domain-containing protein [Geminicoccaceae bacterium]